MKSKTKRGASSSSSDAVGEAAAKLNLQSSSNLESQEDEKNEGEDEEGEEVEIKVGDGEEKSKLGEDEGRTKLDEGFFEIEAIRRKRVRKGQLQYLIKWRGWPEASNTWEPLKNLLSISDVIDAFEDSLQSGKFSRKRKRKHGVFKKKHPRASVHEQRNYFSRTRESSKSIAQKRGENEYDPKLSELLGNADGFTVNFQDLENGATKSVSEEPISYNHRIGARRRKPFSVKRFRKDPNMEDALSSQTPNLAGNNSFQSAEESRSGSVITKIIRPISFSASFADDSQDVIVNFVATRADGKETIVDNRFLKAEYPLLLIDFYEQHLKYIA